MSSTKVTVTTCDLCGYGGTWTEPQDFARVRGYDFCMWCRAEGPSAGRMSCGSHDVTIYGPNDWQCSCGATYGFVVSMMRLRGVPLAVMDAVPDLGRATASAHVQS